MDVMNVTKAFEMIRDMWTLYKKYAGRALADEEYETFTSETVRVHSKYKTSFSRDIVLAIANEIDRTCRVIQKQ